MKGFLCDLNSDMTIGFQYSDFTGKLTIGGNKRFEGEMHEIMHKFLRIPYFNIKGKVTSKNKIKFVCKCSKKFVDEAIVGMMNNNIIFKPAKILERIWW